MKAKMIKKFTQKELEHAKIHIPALNFAKKPVTAKTITGK